MKHVHQKVVAVLGLLLVLCTGLVACSSGGDGGGGGGTSAATVSGTATSPGGQLAKVAPTKLQQFFAALMPSGAWAQAIGGFAPVPNANVFLVRITNAGVPTGTPLILAQTTTNAAGQYTLTLPSGVTLASDLVVQVTNAATPQPIPTAGTQNAPATQATVNVDPISEEVLREVIAFLGANPASTLANFSAFELSELQRVINAAVAANPSLVGATAAQTIANIQASLAPALATTIPVLASSTNFLTVLSTSLPNGQANVAYNQPILAIGNPGALSYAVVGTLPTGLSLNGVTGQITGTPTVAGTFNFSVQVSLPAASPSPVTRALSITLAPPAPAAVASLTPTPQTIQVNTQGSLTVTLNVAQLTDTTVTLSATPGGIVTLPATVQVLANQLSVSFPITAGATAGATQVTATIGASSASADVTVSVAPPLLVFPVQTLPSATVGVPYSYQFMASGGTAPLTWSPILILVGLPPGLTLSPSGLLTGTPTTAGTANFTVQVQDAGIPMQSVSRTLSLTVSPPVATNLTGTWLTNFTCTGTGGNFTGQETLIVTQTGTNVTFTLQPGGGLFTGTLSGNTMIYSGTGPGYTESGTWTMQGANNFTKTSNYVNTDGTGGSCPGTGQRQARLTLTLGNVGPGLGGAVTLVPLMPACSTAGGQCAWDFPVGTLVTLTLSPYSGSSPGPWTGCDVVPQPAVCQVTMNANRNIGQQIN